MTDAFALLPGAGLASIVCAAGWFHLRRRHRAQIDRLAALHKRQIGVTAQRLADAVRRSDVLKQEVLLLKKEIVQQQKRWDRHSLRIAAPVPAADAPRPANVQPHDERWPERNAFADTQPWDPASP